MTIASTPAIDLRQQPGTFAIMLNKGKLMVDATHDQATDTATQSSVKPVADVPPHAVREMTERMASLVAESATRYFNGDTKAALTAQAVLLSQMAADRALQDSPGVLTVDFPSE